MNTDKIPNDLKKLPQWVLWKNKGRNGEKTKVPYQRNGKCAKSDDPRTWVKLKELEKEIGYSGVGFMFSKSDDFCGIDLDGCRNPETGAVEDWAREIVLKFGSYSEVSPSGTGVKIFVRGTSTFKRGRKVATGYEDKYGKTPEIEIYDWGRYFAVTGERLAGCVGIENRQKELDQLCEQWFPEVIPPTLNGFNGQGKVVDRARKYLSKTPPAISGQGGHNTAYRVACVLILGFGLSVDEALPLFREWNQNCQPPWSEREIQHKLEDANKETGERNYLRDANERQWPRINIPEYKQPEKIPEVQTLKGSVEKYLGKVARGETGLIKLGIGDIDYAIGGGVEEGEFIVIGARPSHGKSLVALQCIDTVTQNQIPALMISEEMSSVAIGKRVVSYATDIPQEDWKADFAEVVGHTDEHFENREKCYVVESCGTVERAAETIRKVVAEKGVRFVVVDYVQFLQGKGKSRYEQVTNVSKTLKQVTNETKVTMIVLAQLSREIEGRDRFIPRMKDLKESGQLEQDADVILFLCWPHRLDPSLDPKEYTLFVAKVRNREIMKPVVNCQIVPSRQMILGENEFASTSDHPNYESGFDDFNNS